MSDLEQARDHARAMARAKHRPDCRVKGRSRFSEDGRTPCLGCVTDADRALWRQIADEITTHLARHTEDTLL